MTPKLKSLGLSAARPAEQGTFIRIRPADKTHLKQPVLAKLDQFWNAADDAKELRNPYVVRGRT